MKDVTRAEAVADRLRSEIIDGTYLSGERLRELMLGQRLHVSQATIRQALGLLEHEGWVVKRPRRGVTVRAFTPAEADDVYTLIGALMPLVFESVADAARKPRLRELNQMLEAARSAAEHSHTAAGMAALIGWNLALAALSERPVTAELLAGLLRRAHLIEAVREARVPMPPRDLHALVTRHIDVQRALGIGDLDLVRRLYAPIIDTLRAAAVDALKMG